MTQIPAEQQHIGRARVVALWLSCLLTSVHVRVGRNTWLNAVFVLLTAVLKMSGGNLSLYLKEELQPGQGVALQLFIACHFVDTFNHSHYLFLHMTVLRYCRSFSGENLHPSWGQREE